MSVDRALFTQEELGDLDSAIGDSQALFVRWDERVRKSLHGWLHRAIKHIAELAAAEYDTNFQRLRRRL
jgi:hypothetical protein